MTLCSSEVIITFYIISRNVSHKKIFYSQNKNIVVTKKTANFSFHNFSGLKPQRIININKVLLKVFCRSLSRKWRWPFLLINLMLVMLRHEKYKAIRTSGKQALLAFAVLRKVSREIEKIVT